MSRPQSKKELAEAGRRKLEAFRQQKALAKKQAASGADAKVSSSPASEGYTPEPKTAKERLPSSDVLLTRAPSELPVSTFAQPLSVGESDEDTEASGHNASTSLQNSQGARGPQSVQRAAAPPPPPMRIPFMGSNTGASQVSSPPATAATSPVARSRQHFSGGYQSRLPPPPPVFKPPVPPPASNSTPSGQLSNPSPWRPAALNRTANQSSTPTNAQTALQRPPVARFNPSQSKPANGTDTEQHTTYTPSARGKSVAVTEVIARPDSAAASVGQSPVLASLASPRSDGGGQFKQEAGSGAQLQSASQLSLADERQAIPGVAIKANSEEDSSRAATFEGLIQERESFLTKSPASREVTASTPSAVSKLKELATGAESPDSPLVLPWSQGPNSTGAASGYASLSDSYLSRPPSQTPSQVPSPSKPAQRAQQGSPGFLAASQQSTLPALASSNSSIRSPSGTAALLSPVKSPQHAKHAFQTTANTAHSDSASGTSALKAPSSPLATPRPSFEAGKPPFRAPAVPPWLVGSSMASQASQQQPARQAAQHQPARQLPWEEPESARTADEASLANGDGQLDLATAHSSSSGEAGPEAKGKPANGLRTMHKGSQASLADSLASGSQPAKASKFAALQQHIDDLTREKFELVRGLQEQQRMAASLAQENMLATEDFNRQAEALQQTRKELQQLEGQLQGQLQGQEQLAAERDSFKAGAHAAADQSKSLASEVVALEEKVLQVRSREIRLQKETERLQEGLQEAEKQLQSSRQDREHLLATIDLLQEEKKSLLAKLRQSPLQPQTHTQSAEAHSAKLPHAASPRSEAGQASASGQSSVSTTGRTATGTAEEADQDAFAGRLHSNAGASTSQRIANEALALHQQRHQPGTASSSLHHGLDQSLGRILHKGPGAAEQQQLLESIHTMIGDLEAEKQTFVARQHSQQAEIQHLHTVNSDLQRKLETQTQRLELAIQQQAHATPRAAYSSSSPTFMTAAPFQPDSGRAEPQLQPFSPQLQQTGLQLEPTSTQLRQAGPQLWPGVQVLSDVMQQEQQKRSIGQQPLQGAMASAGEHPRQGPGGVQGGQDHDRHVQSAPPTPMPQRTPRPPSHVQSESKTTGVWGWLGNVIAPRPKQQKQSLIS